MKFNLEHLSNVKKKLTFEIPYGTIKDEIEKSYKSLQKEVSVKGFRKGKTPRTILEKYYQSDIEQEVLTKVVRSSCLKAFSESSLDPVGEPDIHIDQFKPEEDLKYSAIVEILPEIEVKNYQGIALTKETVTVDDGEIDEILARVRDNYAELKTAGSEKVIENNDFAIIDYTLKLDENLLEEKNDAYLQVSLSNLNYGFEDRLLGHKTGDELSFAITLPENHPDANLASKEIQVFVRIKEVKEKILPEINDDFAKQLGEYENLEALKEEMKVTVLRDKELAIRGKQEKELLKHLREENSVEIPDALLGMEINSVTSEYARSLAMSGVKPTKEQLEKHFDKIKEEAAIRIHNSLLLKKIAEKENLSISDDEVNAQISLMTQIQANREKEYRKFFEKEENFENLRENLKAKKAIALLFEKANYKD